MTTTDRGSEERALAARGGPATRALPAVTALALLVDAVVHVHLAPGYQLSAPGGIGAGNLFRLQAISALAVAVWVLLRGTRGSYAAAFLIAFSALGAVLLYRYVNVPMLGPLPAMYEPVWFPEKSISAIGEAVAAVAAAGALLIPHRKALARSRLAPDLKR